jgi:hypothetical protein
MNSKDEYIKANLSYLKIARKAEIIDKTVNP